MGPCSQTSEDMQFSSRLPPKGTKYAKEVGASEVLSSHQNRLTEGKFDSFNSYQRNY